MRDPSSGKSTLDITQVAGDDLAIALIRLLVQRTTTLGRLRRLSNAMSSAFTALKIRRSVNNSLMARSGTLTLKVSCGSLEFVGC